MRVQLPQDDLPAAYATTTATMDFVDQKGDIELLGWNVLAIGSGLFHALDDDPALRRLIGQYAGSDRYPVYSALGTRSRALLADLEGDDPLPHFATAIDAFTAMPWSFYEAVTRFERARWLARHDHADQAQDDLDRAQVIFEGLGATPWLERISELTAA